MFSTSLLLLLAAASYVHGEELTQPASMTVQPGQSLSINCKVSYSVTSYYTAWIRQPAGKALEWIGYIADVHGEELTQPASMTVQPGQSLSINCKVSYSVTSYATAWIRQPAGKTLEWIGYIVGGSAVYSDKLKNKFSLSSDTSTNTITIRGQNMQTEDTAVYYCARYPQ
ncbi:hypothetical protein C0J45_13019 [Silurus meridionalis]|nr:hypothetical protein C0J45_13019 [Silurus meridionalis]